MSETRSAGGWRGLLALHAGVSIPAAAVVAAFLGALAFDFSQPLAQLLPHAALWGVRGVALALLVSAVLSTLDRLWLAVAAGALAGLALGVVTGQGGWQLLFHAGAGVVVGALVQLISILEARDVAPSLLMSLFFFLLITTFWIAKSIKKGLFVGYYKTAPLELLGFTLSGAGAEQLAKVTNMLAVVLAMIAFSWLARRLRRERLVYVFAALFVVLFVALSRALAAPSAASVWAFYITGDMFNSVMVASFFAFLNDSVVPAQAKRMYALVVFGGVFGGAFGTTTVRALQKSVGDQRLVLVCAAAVLAMAGVAALAAARLGARPDAEPDAAGSGGAGSPALEGARLVFRSRYLLSLVAIVGIYEFCSATLDYQWTATQVTQLADEAAIKRHTTTVYTITTWSAMVIQLLVTGPLIRRFGVGAALLVLPGAFLLNSTAFLLLPILPVAAGLNVTENSLNYSINQSARETLYVPTSRAEKYQAKAFIDMFVQRFAKTVAVGLALVFDVLGPAYARWLSIPVLALLVVWIGAARFAGRRFDTLAGSS